MTPGNPIYLDGIKHTFCGWTKQGLAKVLSAGRFQTVRRDRLRRKLRADKGGKRA